MLTELANETVKYVFPNRKFESRNFEEALMSGNLESCLGFFFGFGEIYVLHLVALDQIKFRILRLWNSRF